MINFVAVNLVVLSSIEIKIKSNIAIRYVHLGISTDVPTSAPAKYLYHFAKTDRPTKEPIHFS